MQRERSSMGSLPDTITFDLNPTATDANIDPPAFWNSNIQNYAHDLVPEFLTSNTNDSSTYSNSANQAQNLSCWNMSESSSSGTQNHAIRSEQSTEHGSVNGIFASGLDLNQTVGQMPYSPLFMQSANTYPQDLNIGIEVGNSNSQHRLEENVRGPSSASGGYFGEENYSSDGRRLSCKRKAMEGNIGQSSSSGSASHFQPREGNGWNNAPGWCDNSFGSSTSTTLENSIRASPPVVLSARLGLSGGGNTSESPLPPNMTPNIASSRRNHRVRMSSSPQQSQAPALFPNGNVSGDSSVLAYPQSPLLVPSSNLLGTRTPQPNRWSRSSSSRGGYSLSFGDSVPRPNEELELNRSNPENPTIIPTVETRDSTHLLPDWGSTRASMSGNLSINGNVARNAHPISGPSRVLHRAPPRNARRLYDYVRRLPASPLTEGGVQLQAGSSSQAAASSGAGGNHVDRLSRVRSALLLETQLDSASDGTNSSQTVVAGSEGRVRLVSEIRNILDLMRRGEGLRLEDMVVLEQSGFFGMADIHDRHRDMRLDVDNMSYEELLALGERIGDVNTGLSEDTIFKQLKQKKFFSIAMGAQSELEPCCICREDYNDGEDIGTVECGHEFHSGCIKQWLMLKNSCPICKTTALNK